MSVAQAVPKGKENQEIWILIMPESDTRPEAMAKTMVKKKKKVVLRNVNNCSRNVFPNQIAKEKVSEHGWENKSRLWVNGAIEAEQRIGMVAPILAAPSRTLCLYCQGLSIELEESMRHWGDGKLFQAWRHLLTSFSQSNSTWEANSSYHKGSGSQPWVALVDFNITYWFSKMYRHLLFHAPYSWGSSLKRSLEKSPILCPSPCSD